MLLHVRHVTTYRYDTPHAVATMLLRLWPRSHGGQTVLRWTVRVGGKSVYSHDDGRALCTLRPVPDTVDIIAEGTVETRDVAGVTPLTPGSPNPLVFLKHSPLTIPDDAIVALAQDVRDAAEPGEGDRTLAILHRLNQTIHARIAYTRGASHHHTTAAEVLADGTGVCQDHAHLFVSAARALSIPARYIVGYLIAGDHPEALHETHAWAEALVPDLGWVGFDPSAAVCPDARYIKLIDGLDAHDAAPIRGHVQNGKARLTDADVRIAVVPEGEAPPQSQSQQQQAQVQARAPATPDAGTSQPAG